MYRRETYRAAPLTFASEAGLHVRIVELGSHILCGSKTNFGAIRAPKRHLLQAH